MMLALTLSPRFSAQRSAPPLLCASDGLDDLDGFFKRQLLALPDSPDTCLLQLRKAVQEALDAGSTRLWIDVNVPELDSNSRGFDPDILGKFALGAAQELDAFAARGAAGSSPVILAHGLTTALAATKAVRDANFADGIGAACVVPLIPGSAADDDDAEDEGSIADDEGLARLAASSTCPLLILGPATGQAEHGLSQQWRTKDDAQERVMLLFNHRPERGDEGPTASGSRRPGSRLAALARGLVGSPPPPPPILLDPPASFDIVFELAPLALQDAALNRGASRAAASGDGSAPPSADSFLSVRGRISFVPKAVLVRRFPAAWALLANADDSGYREVRSFERRPKGPSLIDAVGRHVRERQLRLLNPTEAGGGGSASGGGEEATPPALDASPAGAGRRVEDQEVEGGGTHTGAAPPSIPDGVRCLTWAELDSGGSGGPFQWYQAGCLLRLRSNADGGEGGEGGAGNALWADDQSEGTLHLFAAEPEGWRARPPRLAGCALLRLDASEPGRAVLSQVSVAATAPGAWTGRLLEAADALAMANAQRSVCVQARQGGDLMEACQQRGYTWGGGGGGGGGGGTAASEEQESGDTAVVWLEKIVPEP